MRGVLEIGAELQSPPFLWPQETFLNIAQPKAHRCHHAIDEESIFRSSFSSHFCWLFSFGAILHQIVALFFNLKKNNHSNISFFHVRRGLIERILKLILL